MSGDRLQEPRDGKERRNFSTLIFMLTLVFKEMCCLVRKDRMGDVVLILEISLIS